MVLVCGHKPEKRLMNLVSSEKGSHCAEELSERIFVSILQKMRNGNNPQQAPNAPALTCYPSQLLQDVFLCWCAWKQYSETLADLIHEKTKKKLKWKHAKAKSACQWGTTLMVLPQFSLMRTKCPSSVISRLQGNSLEFMSCLVFQSVPAGLKSDAGHSTQHDGRIWMAG